MIGKCNSGVGSNFSAIITVEDANNKTITATLDGNSITGIWNGKNYICTVNKKGNWVVSDGSNSQTISITTATNYNVKLGNATLTTLAGTYWRWDTMATGTTKSYNINFTSKYQGNRKFYILYKKLYVPFGVDGSPFEDGSYKAAYYYAWDTNHDTIAGSGYQSIINAFLGCVASANTWGAGYAATGAGTSTDNKDDARYFHIVDGSSATNSTLISLIQSNATQCDSNWNPL